MEMLAALDKEYIKSDTQSLMLQARIFDTTTLAQSDWTTVEAYTIAWIAMIAEAKRRGLHKLTFDVLYTMKFMHSLPPQFHTTIKTLFVTTKLQSLTMELVKDAIVSDCIYAIAQEGKDISETNAMTAIPTITLPEDPIDIPAKGGNAPRVPCKFCGAGHHIKSRCPPICKKCTFLHYDDCPSEIAKKRMSQYKKQPDLPHREINDIVRPVKPSSIYPRPILDGGANLHLFNDKSILSDYTKNPVTASTAGNSAIHLEGEGTLNLDLKTPLTLTNVFYSNKARRNLISASQLMADKSVILLTKKKGFLVDEIKVTPALLSHITSTSSVTFTVNNGLWEIDDSPSQPTHLNSINTITTLTSADIWHRRMSHLNLTSLKKLQSDGLIPADVKLTKLSFCEACILGKHSRTPFPKESIKPTTCLHTVVSDLFFLSTTGLDGSKCGVNFKDVATGYNYLVCMSLKSSTYDAYVAYDKEVTNYHERGIKIFRSDGGGEYKSTKFYSYLKSRGTKPESSCSETSQQNAIAERHNRILDEKSSSDCAQSGAPLWMWTESYHHANYVYNRSPSQVRNGLTPYELWYGTPPDISTIKTFGSDAWAKIPKSQQRKGWPKSRPCKMLRMDDEKKGYRLWDIRRQCIIISRDVKFQETFKLPWEIHLANPNKFTNSTTGDDFIIDPNQFASFGNDEEYIPDGLDESDSDESDSDSDFLSAPTDNSGDSDSGISQMGVLPPAVAALIPELPVIGPVALPVETRQSGRTRQPPKYLETYELSHLELLHAQSQAESIQTILDSTPIPSTYQQAISSIHKNDWTLAMMDEISSMEKNKVFELVPRPHKSSGIRVIGSRWVYDKKTDGQGHVTRLKARFIARGFTQVLGIDYTETFAPTLKSRSFKMLLALANQNGWNIRQLDIKTAFLNADIGETEVFLRQPDGFINKDHPEYVWKLNKSIYGLKQSPRNWYTMLSSFLISLGFQPSTADPCIYIRGDAKTNHIFVGVYVDDLPITSPSSVLIEDLVQQLRLKFEIKDLGELTHCLGINVTRDKINRQMKLSQPEYTMDILDYFNMLDSHPAKTPMEANLHLSKSMSPQTTLEQDLMKDIEYRTAVGKLIFLTITTRPDISYAVGEVSRFVANPGIQHWDAVKRILRYLNGTRDYGLNFNGMCQPIPTLLGYSDADWGGNIDDRKSKTGYAIFWCGGLISWKSKFQASVALSTVEAEYIAACTTGREIAWLRKLAIDFGYPQEATVIREDNQGCIANSNNPLESEQMKHIAIQNHWVRDEVSRGQIILEYCPTNEMIADTLTKSLVKDKFIQHRNALLVWNHTPTTLEGGC